MTAAPRHHRLTDAAYTAALDELIIRVMATPASGRAEAEDTGLDYARRRWETVSEASKAVLREAHAPVLDAVLDILDVAELQAAAWARGTRAGIVAAELYSAPTNPYRIPQE